MLDVKDAFLERGLDLDRELLELAALSCDLIVPPPKKQLKELLKRGDPYWTNAFSNNTSNTPFASDLGLWVGFPNGWDWFDSLYDDLDAFGLIVAHDMEITWNNKTAIAKARTKNGFVSIAEGLYEVTRLRWRHTNPNDKGAALRLAITKVAAEIQRQRIDTK